MELGSKSTNCVIVAYLVAHSLDSDNSCSTATFDCSASEAVNRRSTLVVILLGSELLPAEMPVDS